jgi:hypothetical protein
VDNQGERRSKRRWRTILKGRVVFNNRSSAFDCTIQNLSDIGALLTFAHVSPPPQDFELEIPSKNLRVPARVIWSRGKNHGISFVQGLDEGEQSP